jgi:putative transposase
VGRRLRDYKRRGMQAPVLAVGDGALGFGVRCAKVFSETTEQRCWFHKISNILAVLPKSARSALCGRRHSDADWIIQATD